MSRGLNEAIKLRNTAEQLIGDVLRHDYPVGAAISWRRGGSGSIIRGRVISHNRYSCDRLLCENEETGTRYTVKAHWVVGEQ